MANYNWTNYPSIIGSSTGGSTGSGSGFPVVIVGPLDGASPSVNGGVISSATLYFQSFTNVFPGLVNSTSQTFSGIKTFNSAPNLNSLTASLPLQLDVSKNIISQAINLASSQVTGNLPLSQTSGSISLTNQVSGLLPISQVSGSLSFSNLTGSVSLTNQVSGILPNANMSSVALGNSAQVTGSISLSNQVSGSLPISQISGSLSLTGQVSGILPIANGGTNSTAIPGAGAMVYGSASSYAFTSNANLFWDQANKKLGLGNTSPLGVLEVDSANSVLIRGLASATNVAQSILRTDFATIINSTSSYVFNGWQLNAQGMITGSVTNTGAQIGLSMNNLRNFASTADNGTLSVLSAIAFAYGHTASDVTATPITTTAKGIDISPTYRTGTVTAMYDIFLRSDDLGGAGGTVVTRYGIFQQNIAQNSFAGRIGIGTLAPGAALDVKSTIRISGSTSGFFGLTVANSAGSTTFTLPIGDGTNGQALTTNGAGTLSWATPSVAASFNNVITSNTYIALINDYVNFSAGSISTSVNVTLPTAIGNSGKLVGVNRVDMYPFTQLFVIGTASQFVGTTGSLSIFNNQSFVFESDGTNWQIQSDRRPTIRKTFSIFNRAANGSTNVRIPYFSGSASFVINGITYTTTSSAASFGSTTAFLTCNSDAVNGTTFTINEPGLYTLNGVVNTSAVTTDQFGWVVNIASGIVSLTSQSTNAILTMQNASGMNAYASPIWTGILNKNDVISLLQDGAGVGNLPSIQRAYIEKIGDL